MKIDFVCPRCGKTPTLSYSNDYNCEVVAGEVATKNIESDHIWRVSWRCATCGSHGWLIPHEEITEEYIDNVEVALSAAPLSNLKKEIKAFSGRMDLDKINSDDITADMDVVMPCQCGGKLRAETREHQSLSSYYNGMGRLTFYCDRCDAEQSVVCDIDATLKITLITLRS